MLNHFFWASIIFIFKYITKALEVSKWQKASTTTSAYVIKWTHYTQSDFRIGILLFFPYGSDMNDDTIYPSAISTSSLSSLRSSWSLTVGCRTYTIRYIKGPKQTVVANIMKNHVERGNLFGLFFNIRIGLDGFNVVTKHGPHERLAV